MRTLAVGLLLILGLAACGKVLAVPDAGSDDIIDAVPIDAESPDADVRPIITSLAPPAGIVTTQVTLTGTRLGVTQGTSTVTFGGAVATIVSWSDTAIVARVPNVLPAAVDVVVTTAGGTSDAQSFRVHLPPMVYLNNGAVDPTVGFNTVTVLSFNPTTGTLTQVGAPVSTGTGDSGWGGCATAAVVHEGSRQLFVSGGSQVAIFDIDPVTGAITPAAGSPFTSGGSTAWGMHVNRAGTRLFVAHVSGGIGVLDISGPGATPIAGSPFAAENVHGIALTQDEAFLFANSESNSFFGMSVATSGALAPIAGSPFATTERSFSFGTMRPGADHLYIPRAGNFAAFAVAPTTGAPAEIVGSPFTVTLSAGQLHYPTFNSIGSRLYIGTFGSGLVSGFGLDAAGTPTALAGSPWDFTATINGMSCIAVSRDNRYLVGNMENNKQVAVFSLAVDGTPTQVAGSPFTQTTATESASGMALTF